MVLDIKSVLVLDYVGVKCMQILGAHGIQVTKKWSLTEEELIEEIPNYDALIVQSVTKVTKKVLQAAKKLKVIVSAVGYFNNVDIFAAMTNKLGVINSPRSSIINASEYGCGLVIAMARKVFAASRINYIDGWLGSHYTGALISGSVVAFIGLGDVAREMAVRLNAFGVTLIGYDVDVTREQCKEFFVKKRSLESIWHMADYIILFTPPYGSCLAHIDSEMLKECQKGVKLIIMGSIGSYQAQVIYHGLVAEQLSGAAFDMYEEGHAEEPLKVALANHQAVIVTTHHGVLTDESVEQGGQEAAEQLVNLCKPGTFETPLSVIVRVDGM